jgi:ferredoxin-NADP reductase
MTQQHGVESDGLGDLARWALIEAEVEQAMAQHQEPDGTYACDPHVMISYVREAIDRHQPRETSIQIPRWAPKE